MYFPKLCLNSQWSGLVSRFSIKWFSSNGRQQRCMYAATCHILPQVDLIVKLGLNWHTLLKIYPGYRVKQHLVTRSPLNKNFAGNTPSSHSTYLRCPIGSMLPCYSNVYKLLSHPRSKINESAEPSIHVNHSATKSAPKQ